MLNQLHFGVLQIFYYLHYKRPFPIKNEKSTNESAFFNSQAIHICLDHTVNSRHRTYIDRYIVYYTMRWDVSKNCITAHHALPLLRLSNTYLFVVRRSLFTAAQTNSCHSYDDFKLTRNVFKNSNYQVMVSKKGFQEDSSEIALDK